jgi:hypothetical protein
MQSGLILGVLLGFGAAVCQSLSYLFSRLFVLQRHQTVLRLLVLGHLLMGAISVFVLPLAWPEQMAPWQDWLWPLVGASGFYVLGQGAFFLALKHAEASRAAPLLGLKILVLAMITAGIMHQPLVPWQWVAVALATGAAFMLNYSGGSLNAPAIVGILAACLFYSISDIHIRLLVDALALPSRMHASVLGAVMSYTLLGVAALPAVLAIKPVRRGDFRYAVPFALAWLAAMFCLYGAFAYAGVVLGNIVQSTRGLISIALGVMIARRGWEHLEAKVSRRVLLRRLVAAAMMIGAIALYVWSGQDS